MNFPNRQRGIGVAGWLILLLVFGSVMTAAAKLMPLYMDHNTISNLMDKLAAEEGVGKKRKRDIIAALENRFKLNNIRNFPLEENLTFQKKDYGKAVVLEYEVRVPLVHKIDLIASFDKAIELRN